MRQMRFALQLTVFLTLAFSVNAATPAWDQLAQLTASDGQPLDGLGSSVSISGGTIVAGSPGAAGAAYVFVKSQSGWTNMTQVAKLTASDGQHGDSFGLSVSISGNTIVVGAPCANSCQGAAYVFVKPVGGWADMTETAKLTTSDGQANDVAAESTSISGNTIALGAAGKTVKGIAAAGEVYVYEKPSGGWANMTETVKFAEGGNNHGHGGIQFGTSVDLGGDTLIVGAPYTYLSSLNRGAVFVFVKAANGWKYTTRTSELFYSKPGKYLGQSAAITNDGGTVVGGAENSPSPGRVLIFVKPSTGWPTFVTETATLTDGTGSGDAFGSAVAVSNATVVAGAANPGNLGAAYVFSRPPTGWKTTHKYQASLMASDEAADWVFGASVAINGSTSVVGAWGWSNAQGTAFVFGK